MELANSMNNAGSGRAQAGSLTYLRAMSKLLNTNLQPKKFEIADTYNSTLTSAQRVPGAIPDVGN